MYDTIKTENLILIPASNELLEAAIENNSELAKALGVKVPDDWTEFGKEPLFYFLEKLKSDPGEKYWCNFFPIHKTLRILIGSCGYKGKPTQHGSIEIGYEIAPDYRQRGFASEIVKALIENALTCPEVRLIIAHTLPEINASTRILSKFNFTKTEEINDPQDGLIWKWQLTRDEICL